MTAVAGIGNPQRFFDNLSAQDLEFKPMIFPDHHAYTRHDFSQMDICVLGIVWVKNRFLKFFPLVF